MKACTRVLDMGKTSQLAHMFVGLSLARMPIQDVTQEACEQRETQWTQNHQYQRAFVQLGKEWDVSGELMDKLEKFTFLMYGAKSGATKVNDLRYHLFSAKKAKIKSHQLPTDGKSTTDD